MALANMYCILFPFLIGRIRTIQKKWIASFYLKKVSIPHRQDKNLSWAKSCGEGIKVSIPHRQDKNDIDDVNLKKKTEVSIPHRQDKNVLQNLGKEENILFPFLIGRIRTANALSPHMTPNQFPFLIGRIRTKQEYLQIYTIQQLFPFLIGRIRTILQ